MSTARVLIKVLAVLLICSFELFSQEQNELSESAMLTNIADSLMIKRNYDLAADNYLMAMQYYLDIDETQWYFLFGRFRKARAKSKRVSKLIEELLEISEYLDQDHILLNGKVLFYIGYYYSRFGLTNHAISAYKEAINELSSLKDNPKAKRFLLYTYENLALKYSRIGDQKSAIRYINLGIDIVHELEDQSKMCSLLLNYSKFLFYDNNFKDVKNKLNLALNECNLEEDRGLIYDYFAEVYIKQDSLELARHFLEKSLELSYEKDHLFYEISAEYYKKKNHLNKAENQYKMALSKLRGTISRRLYLKTFVLYSDLLYRNSKKEEAIQNSHLALRLYYPDLDSLDITDRSKINEVLPDVWIIEALNIKAQYFRDKYIETKDEFSFKEATFYYNLLLSHFDRLKSKYYSSSSQYRMGAYSQGIYSDVISFFIDQYSQDGKISNLDNAFSLAQRANSFVLRNAVSDRKALEMAGVNQDSLEQYLFLASKVSSDNNEDSTGNGGEMLFEFDTYKESLLVNYPSYYKYDKEEEITIEEIQSTIDENALLLKYYYFGEKLSVFGVTKNATFAENISFPKEIDSLINSNLSIISQNRSNDSLVNMYLSNSKTLYDLVIGDLLQKFNLTEIDHLIIIPDGPLKKVSFNTLVVNDSGNWNEPSTYLLNNYTVNYLYYSSQLKNTNKSYDSKNGFIGFGIEYEDDFLKEIIGDYMSSFKNGEADSRAISLSPLKYADDEVLTTAEILGGTTFINSEVTPSQVYSTINNFDVVHFSAHAFVDEEDYLNSFVVLNRDAGENYQLKYSDILNLDLDSEMVVLSACQTGSGKSVVGEGLMSLSRAFVQSGSNSAVGAYWNAPDYSTKELMALFYSNLKDGMSKSKAMQQAQIEYLTNDDISSPTIRSPFFWASWAVYGDDQPLRMSTSIIDFTSWKTYLVLLLGLFLVFAILRQFKKRSRN